ncbi:MAG: DUF2147 domain-containing protein [Myxococcota bacterium]
MPNKTAIIVSLLLSTLALQAAQPVAHASGRPPRRAGETEEVTGDAIIGYWQRNVGEAVVEIQRQGTGYVGVVVESDRRPELLGTTLFRALRFDAKRQVWRGRVYSADRDREFNAEIRVRDQGRIELTVKVAFITRNVDFNRHSIPGALASAP